jgi:hypothetical protein
VSVGTRFGVPLIAAEPLIAAAVLGLFGVREADSRHLGGGNGDPTGGDSLGALLGACYYVRRSPFARRRAMS